MAELPELIISRGRVKARLTKFITFIQRCDDEPGKRVELPYRLEKLADVWSEFDKIQSQIETIDTTSAQALERDTFEDNYYEVVAKAHNYSPQASSPAATSAGPQTVPNVNIDCSNNVRLPIIDLPKFDGSLEQWLSFRDIFLSLIDGNRSLSNIQKLHYLRSSLIGSAAKVAHSLGITADNYQTTWNLLKDRFENKKLIIQHHVQALLSLNPNIKESCKDLRQFVDGILQHVETLRRLEQPVEYWDTILILTLLPKLDAITKREWEKERACNSDLPTIKEFTNFLIERCTYLEALERSNSNSFVKAAPQGQRAQPNKVLQKSHVYTTINNVSCPLCNHNHKLYECSQFRKLNSFERHNAIKRLKICLNCLKPFHGKNCTAGSCRVCNQHHNTLLHFERKPDAPFVTEIESSQPQAASQTNSAGVYPRASVDNQVASASCSYISLKTPQQVLLSTAVLWVRDRAGQHHECRALLDSGSQSNFITEALCKKLQLEERTMCTPITGIGESSIFSASQTIATVASKHNSFKTKLQFLTIKEITNHLPAVRVEIANMQLPSNIILADPTFNTPGKIDMILGASIFWELLCVGQIRLGQGQPTFQKTKLGWVITGTIGNNNHRSHQSSIKCYLTNTARAQDIQDQLERFWKVEEVPTQRHLTEEERICEQHFLQTHKRNEDGRFVVELPLREDARQLGDSLVTATNRFLATERRLHRNPELQQQYTEFMSEYLELKHMSEVFVDNSSDQGIAYYLPHHPVIKEESTTTRMRVVFDASCKTESGKSLNDILMVGPTIQQDLLSILLRFRQHKYAFAADITKMYRQIELAEQYRSLQRILWRWSADEPIRIFQLNTVTYGMASSSFLAIRTLQQVARENLHSYPAACDAIINDFYVDDLLTGHNTIAQAKQLKNDITHVLETAQLTLRKWKSNNSSLTSDQSQDDSSVLIATVGKTLGILWDTQHDTLQYRVNYSQNSPRSTKRAILSITSQIFDPLGLIGPIIVKMKIILQHLWQLNLGWDESIPTDLHTMWKQCYTQLQTLNNLHIRRRILCNNPQVVELHGFCDSSEAAYGACVYIRSVNANQEVVTQLLCAKSKVAPLKRLSLPRLELCGALLLTRLYKRVLQSLNLTFHNTYLWTDSTIVLAWIAGEAHQWNTFVANRIAEIHQETDKGQWHHVRSERNPADIISRGIPADQIQELSLWWEGPAFLQQANIESFCSGDNPKIKEVPERKRATIALTAINTDSSNLDIITRFSSLTRLKRATAYCLRFAHNTRHPNNKKTGPLEVSELGVALHRLIKLIQKHEFSYELRDLNSNKEVSLRSKLKELHPFLDHEGIIRVGGRLTEAPLPYDHKHPIVLPSKHHFTRLIIRDEHLRHLHAGAQAILASIRTNYWPLSGKGAIRSVLRKCTVCFRARPVGVQQLMGNLPASRLTPARAFTHVGVDYGGPFTIKVSRNKTAKAYLCIFICFSTKAVHIELVVDLSTYSFLNALKRFIARRGKCSSIHSDNGTNFVGANNTLKEVTQFLKESKTQNDIREFLTNQSIQWNFIPPRSPHQGGLWEAAIKSAKSHLYKILKNTPLTFEELYTVLTQIEACLNSRPLTPMSNDPSDLCVLTPGHFLINDSLTSLPEQDLSDVPINRLDRYQLLALLKQHFWSRWTKEYLSSLQHRSKWTHTSQSQIEPGVLVLLREENSPTMCWPIGRIVELHPGKDGITRIVTVKTAHGIYQRAVQKICILPIEHTS